MAKQGTILVVDDNKAVLNALEMLLAGVFREVITIRTPNQIEAILESGRVDVVLLDMNFSAGIILFDDRRHGPHQEAHRSIKATFPFICSDNVTGFPSKSGAVKSM